MNRIPTNDPAEWTLAQLCEAVINGVYFFRDLSDYFQDAVYVEYDNRGVAKTARLLERVAAFLEGVENKTEKVCRDLGEIYEMMGELYQHAEEYNSSVQWFEKAILVDDRDDQPYHNLATSYIRMGNSAQAIRCLEQELVVAPGNYYAYFVLADIYEQVNDEEGFERTLESLLERNPSNIRAMHKLISHYERQTPHIDVQLLRRRLTGSKTNLSRREITIWSYHMCQEKRFEEAEHYLLMRLEEKPDFVIIYLLLAHLYGVTRQRSRQAIQFTFFIAACQGRREMVENTLREFSTIYGEKAARTLRRHVDKPIG